LKQSLRPIPPDVAPTEIQSDEPDPAQDVVSQHGAGEHQIVGREFARRQSLDIEIGFEFGMELFARAVRAIERDHLGLVDEGFGQRRPPAFERDVGHQQFVTVAVDRALGDAHDAAKGARFAAKLLLDRLRENADALAFARASPDRFFLGPRQPAD